MKKITKGYYYKNTSKRTSKIIKAIDELKVNEGLEFKKHEYRGKSRFNIYVGASFPRKYSDKKFKTNQLKDGSGWAVLRIK
jgi:hypothetical protein